MYIHKIPPSPPQTTPFPGKSAKLVWAILTPTGQNVWKVVKTFLEVGKKNYSSPPGPWLRWPRLPLGWRPNQRYCRGTGTTRLGFHTMVHRSPWWQLAASPLTKVWAVAFERMLLAPTDWLTLKPQGYGILHKHALPPQEWYPHICCA